MININILFNSCMFNIYGCNIIIIMSIIYFHQGSFLNNNGLHIKDLHKNTQCKIFKFSDDTESVTVLLESIILLTDFTKP